MGKDYYKVLGIDKSATQDDVKKAFRKQAHKYHPDKETGDEAKFKEANEAYQVLGKPEKRQQYDQYGSNFDQQGGFGGGGNWEDFMRQARQGGGGGAQNMDFGDLGDIFGDMFGFGGNRSRGGSRVVHGDDIQMDMSLDFSESVFGLKKEIKIFKQVKCSHCQGNLAEPGTPIKTCTTCNGNGQVVRIQRTMLGTFQTAAVCSDCRGEGKIAEKKCTSCEGHGIEEMEVKLDVQVPGGIVDGMTLRLSGQGHAGHYGGPTGDLYIRIHVKEDKNFTRVDDDIHTKQNISFVQASLGVKVEVKTLDGDVELKIPAGTQPGTKFRLKAKGVPHINASGRGDMFVETIVEVPKKLTRKQKQLLEDFDL